MMFQINDGYYIPKWPKIKWLMNKRYVVWMVTAIEIEAEIETSMIVLHMTLKFERNHVNKIFQKKNFTSIQ